MIGKKSMIELNFNEVQVDYFINRDFEILSTNNFKTNDTIIIFDEQNRKYVISNYNLIYSWYDNK